MTAAIQKPHLPEPVPSIAKASGFTGGNIMYRMQALVLRIQTQLSQLSQNTQKDTQKMKKEYRVYSGKTAELQREQGKSSFWFTLCSTVAGAAVPAIAEGVSTTFKLIHPQEFNSFVKAGGEFAAAFTNGSGQWYNGGLREKETIANARYQLLQTEIGNKDAQNSDQSNLKQILDQALSSIREVFRSASR